MLAEQIFEPCVKYIYMYIVYTVSYMLWSPVKPSIVTLHLTQMTISEIYVFLWLLLSVTPTLFSLICMLCIYVCTTINHYNVYYNVVYYYDKLVFHDGIGRKSRKSRNGDCFVCRTIFQPNSNNIVIRVIYSSGSGSGWFSLSNIFEN